MTTANQQQPGRDFVGWIDEAGVTSRALSAQEVRDMYSMAHNKASIVAPSRYLR